MTETPTEFANRVWSTAERLLPKNSSSDLIRNVAKALNAAEHRGAVEAYNRGIDDARSIYEPLLAAAKIGGGK